MNYQYGFGMDERKMDRIKESHKKVNKLIKKHWPAHLLEARAQKLLSTELIFSILSDEAKKKTRLV